MPGNERTFAIRLKGLQYLMNHLSPEEVAHLLSSVSALSARMGTSFSEALRHLIALAETADPRTEARAPRDRREFARRVLRVRQQRNAILGADSFRDPAWDMLLELFAAHESGRKLSVSSLCYASGVPLTTALRHVDRLEEHGLVTRRGDSSDQRRWFVKPTPKALAGVASAAAALLEQSHAVESIDDEDELRA